MEDHNLRKFLKERLYHAGISRIEIERSARRIRLRIFTARPGIIIGKKGAMLKDIGSLARADIERILGTKVFLELWVKVKDKWSHRENLIREFGYGD